MYVTTTMPISEVLYAVKGDNSGANFNQIIAQTELIMKIADFIEKVMFSLSVR